MMNLGELSKAAFAITASGGLMKFGNENYELLKSDVGLAGPLFCLIAGCALAYYGIKSFGRALAR